MVVILSLGLCNAKRRVHATGRGLRREVAGGGDAVVCAHRRPWRAPSSPSPLVRQLVWRFRSQWRHAVGLRRGPVRFGYDPEGYSQNFDDGGGRSSDAPAPPPDSFRVSL